MTVADDLSTLRDYRPDDSRGFSQRRFDAALDRVEAEIARLTEEKDGWQEEARAYELRLRRYDAPAPWEAQVALAEAMCEKAEQRAEAAEAEVSRWRDMCNLRRQRQKQAEARERRLRDGLRQAMTHDPENDETLWDACERLLAEEPPVDAETWGLMQDGAAQPLPRSEYGGYMGGEPWGPDHPSYDEMGQ